MCLVPHNSLLATFGKPLKLGKQKKNKSNYFLNQIINMLCYLSKSKPAVIHNRDQLKLLQI